MKISKIVLSLALFFPLLLITNSARAATYWDLTGATSTVGTVGASMPISDIQVTGSTTPTIPVKLRVTSGTLTIATTTGLTFTNGSSATGGTITFTGNFVDVNNALASLRYTRGGIGSDTLEVSLVNPGEVFFSDNGHLYEYISSSLSWTDAKIAAAQLIRYGAVGYLTTITSSAENAFAASRLTAAGWMDGSDSSVEDVWRWTTGPEAGTIFWNGGIGGSSPTYANWNASEPNDSSSNEDCAQFLSGGSGQWNDLPCSGSLLPGYVVEFGAPGANPTVVAKNVAITTQANPTISSVTPTNGAVSVSTTTDLIINFSTSINRGAGTVTIKRTSDNVTVETINASSSVVIGDGASVITINPVSDLAYDTKYSVLVSNNAFTDLSANAFAGISSTSTWSFTTIKSPYALAIIKLQNYADSNGTTTTPTISDYLDAGITTVTADTILVANTTVLNSDGSKLEDTAEIKSVIAQPVAIQKINAYAVTARGDLTPTVSDYVDAGISGVTDANLSQTNAALLLVVDINTISSTAGIQGLVTAKIASTRPVATPGSSYATSQPGFTTQQTQQVATVSTSVSGAIVRDLSTGKAGSDVLALQKFLNVNGYVIAKNGVGSPGKETSSFGSLTKAALISYQKKNNISPAVGYFGPATRLKMKTQGLSGLWW